MGYEQIDLNFNPPNDKDSKPSEPIVIPYSETFQKEEESEEAFIERSFELMRRKLKGEIIVEEPTTDDINKNLEITLQEKKLAKYLPKKNAISSSSDKNMTVRDTTDDVLEAKIKQMRSRKDLDY